ncbi:class I SAM-dependent methyltransferase [Urechidicola sp. KH5]
MNPIKEHWQQVYANTPPEKTGWYQAEASESLLLLSKCNIDKDAHILNVGTGASNFVNQVLDAGYTNVSVNDIAASALEVLQSRIPEEQLEYVRFIEDDLTAPTVLKDIAPVAVWHDRAVLHFFREAHEQQAYFDLLKSKVQAGGYVIIAEFNLEGALKCSGQELHRYDRNMIAAQLGEEFTLLEEFEFTFVNPFGGERPFIYTLFQRA